MGKREFELGEVLPRDASSLQGYLIPEGDVEVEVFKEGTYTEFQFKHKSKDPPEQGKMLAFLKFEKPVNVGSEQTLRLKVTKEQFQEALEKEDHTVVIPKSQIQVRKKRGSSEDPQDAADR